MNQNTNLRALRQRYSIPLSELSTASGLSQQYISQAELGQIMATPRLEHQLETAIAAVITQRHVRLGDLEQSFAAYKGRLLQFEEGTTDE